MFQRADADICNMALIYAGVNVKIGSLTENSAEAQACNTVYAEIRRQLETKFRWGFTIKRVQLTPYSGAAWSATQTYNLNDMAQFGDNVYRSLKGANLNNEPDLTASTAWWFQVTRDGWAFCCPIPADTLELIALWEKPTVDQNGSPPLFEFDQDDELGWNLRNPRSMDRVPFAIENANDGSDNLVLLTDVDAPILKYVAEVTNPSAFPQWFAETFAWHLAVPLAMALRGDEKKAQGCKLMAQNTLADAFISEKRGQQEDEEPVSEFEASREGAP